MINNAFIVFILPFFYQVCGAVHRDLHRLHAHPEVRKYRIVLKYILRVF